MKEGNLNNLIGSDVRAMSGMEEIKESSMNRLAELEKKNAAGLLPESEQLELVNLRKRLGGNSSIH